MEEFYRTNHIHQTYDFVRLGARTLVLKIPFQYSEVVFVFRLKEREKNMESWIGWR